jgi:hypothetical protein
MRTRLSRAGERDVAKASALPALFLFLLAGHASPQAAPAGQDPDAGSFRISVDVALVVLPATVTDRQGGFVSNLAEQDFRFTRTAYRNTSSSSETKIFRSPWDWLSTRAAAWGRNLRR